MKNTNLDTEIKVLIMDDNPIITAVMEEHLRVFFPSMKTSITHEPDAKANFDIYFVDNDFDGEHKGTDLVKEIREIAPNSLIVALSNTLDLEELSEMLNHGCNLIYDKRNPISSKSAREVIQNYLNLLEEQKIQSNKNKLQGAVQSIQHLLSSWNSRLNTL